MSDARWPVLALVVASLAAIQFLPQAWHAVHARELSSISLPAVLLIAVTWVLWTAYGVHLGDLAIIAANSIAFLSAITVSILKVRKG